MPQGVSSKPVFKPYHQHQTTMLPSSLEELICGAGGEFPGGPHGSGCAAVLL